MTEALLRKLVDATRRESNALTATVGVLTTAKLDALDEAEAYLARERGPVARGVVAFHPAEDGWRFETWMLSAPQPWRDSRFMVEIEVPAHLVNPPVVRGEVIG